MQGSTLIIQTLELLCLGAGLGFFGGLFGIGGGIIAIPMLVMGFGMPQAMAQGTVLVIMVPNLLVSWWQYARQHPIPFGTMLRIGVVASLSTWAVAHVATSVNQAALHLVFNVFLLMLGVRLLKVNRAQTIQPMHRPFASKFMPLVGVIGGGCMGLLGVGGGLVATPLFTRWFGQKQVAAQGLSLALVAPSALIALLSYSTAQQVYWSMGAGGILTVSAGVAVAHSLPEAKIRTIFAVMLLLTALWSILRVTLGV
ncbi:hypothetical protein DTO96_101611 [Ephemeroptericola cinctiostellae]|uniref:Probable membrane transporter protein n=1 Tax=Ephemeroptericola cinctiostellae TaxID=2268024 RepID=A0A345DBY3_9BURK|nr:sulfite exporter TauE/SafE family protein [Ephemeroptericola cinctiostellae]AXF85871.1 hypothetical protein DTO96_101611 [Ephemeroptericola cinctiostellae]